MDAFSYLSVLLSIILGLAITQVLQGYRALLLARERVRLSAPVLIWSALVLLIAAQAWWASFGLRDREQWDFLSFAVILLQMGLLYMLAAVIFPDVASGETLDLAEHFEQHRRTFFGFLVAMLAASISKSLVLAHSLPSASDVVFHLLLALIAVAGISWKGARVQLALAIVAASGLLAYIAILFAHLGG